MRIEFDPTNPTEAAAVRAMLTAMAPASGGVVTSTENHLVGEVPSEQTTRFVVRGDQFVVVNGAEEKPVLVNEDGVVLPQADSNGEPHDPRIHSTPPKLNADGTWRAKRGVTAEQVAAVRAEREATTHPEQEDDPRLDGGPIAPGQEVSSNEGPQEVFAASEAPKAPTPPAPPAPVADPVEQFAAEVLSAPVAPSFLDVMKAITAAQKDGKIDTAKVKELCAAVGAGDSTMGLNGADKGEVRVAFMALLGEVVS